MIKLLLIFIIFGCCSTISYAQVRNLYCNVGKDASLTSNYACIFNQQTLLNNEIAQIVPTHFNGTTNLNITVVRFNGSSIYALPSVIFTTFPNTAYISTPYSKIQQIKPNTFLNAVKLINLDLKFNQLTTIPQDAFLGASNLNDLHLGYNMITTIDKNAFRGLPKLTFLMMSYNQFKTLDPLTFSTITSVLSIYLYNSGLTTIDENIFAYNTKLQVASLAYNQFTSLPPNLFKNNLDLVIVYLMENKISSLSYTMFSHLKKLQTLMFDNNVCANFRVMTNPVNMTIVENALKNCTQIAPSPTCVDKSNDLAKIMGNMILDLNTVLGNYSLILSNFIKT
jgi:Leucine-rich repeat (LRR) protein